MAATYEPIASQTLGSNAASMAFDNIPGTFTDLVIVMAYRDTRAQTYSYPRVRVNSDSGSNYSMTRIYGDGSSAGSQRNSSQTYWLTFGEGTGSSNTSGEFAVITATILSYANANVFKTYLLAGANASGGGGLNVGRQVGLWRSTSAITRLDFYADPTAGSEIATGTTISLYGIKAA